MVKPQPPHFPRFTIGRIDIYNGSLKHDISFCNFEFSRQLTDKSVNDNILVHADHRIKRTTHSHICNISCPVGEYSLIRSLNMGVRPIDGRSATIEIPTHRVLLRSCFGMYIDNDDFRMLTVLPQEGIDTPERVVNMVRHENPSLHINNQRL